MGRRRGSIFPSAHPFFGLTGDDPATLDRDITVFKKKWLTDIYLLVKHGGFSYEALRCMPLKSRNFFLDKLIEDHQDPKKKGVEQGPADRDTDNIIVPATINRRF